MRTVVLSFDDSRKDFYIRVFPLLKRYGITVTLNVVSGFVSGRCSIKGAPDGAMTWKQVVECDRYGIEIACHGSNHKNESDDLQQNIEELKQHGIDTARIGFASPTSFLTWQNKNDGGIWNMVEKGEISYIRSGNRLRRNSLSDKILSVLDMILHSKLLFRRLNRKNVITSLSAPFMLSVGVYSYTTVPQVMSFLRHLPQDGAVILTFHSILDVQDKGYGDTKFYWDVHRFEALLQALTCDTTISLTTTCELLDTYFEK